MKSHELPIEASYSMGGVSRHPAQQVVEVSMRDNFGRILTRAQKKQLQAKILSGEYTEADAFDVVLWLLQRKRGYRYECH